MKRPPAFWHWAAWRLRNKQGPRPVDAPKVIPPSWWAALERWTHRHKHPPPPTPPPPPPPPPNNPPSRWPDAPWYKPHVDVSDWVRQYGLPDTIVQRCLQHGIKAIGVQFGNDCPDPDWITNGRAIYQAAKTAGLECYGWGRCDYVDWPTIKAAIDALLPLDGISADIEGECQDKEIHKHLAGEYASKCPLSVVATGGIDNAFATDAVDSAIKFGDYFDMRFQDYYKLNAEPPFPFTIAMGENNAWNRSTDRHDGQGYRHMPKAGNKWHVALLMSNVEGCTPLTEQEGRAKAWVRSGGKVGYWVAELLEANGEWDVFSRIIHA